MMTWKNVGSRTSLISSTEGPAGVAGWLRPDDKSLLYAEAIDRSYCRLCARCEPMCPERVGISVVNRALMYAEGYGEYRLGKATFEEAAMTAACATCTECVARCVNGLDIAAKMRRARSLFSSSSSRNRQRKNCGPR